MGSKSRCKLGLELGETLQVEDVLDDVVAIGVANEGVAVLGDLRDKSDLLLLGGVVETSLHDAAAMTVCGDFHTIFGDRVEQKLVLLGRQAVEAALYHMVAVKVFDEDDNVRRQSVDNKVDLRLGAEKLDHLLNCACPVHVHGDLDDVLADQLDDGERLRFVAVLEQLLAEVVAERVGHQVDNLVENLVEDDGGFLCVFFVELLLQEATAVLVLAQASQVSDAALERGDARVRRQREVKGVTRRVPW